MLAMWWYTLLALFVLSGLPSGGPGVALADDCLAAVDWPLAVRLRAGITSEAVFGLPWEEARWVFYPVTNERPHPADYVPPDLVRTTAGGAAPAGPQPVRQLILPDLEAMFAAARADGVVLGIYSGYRSYQTQAAIFESGVRQQLARGGASRAEAEARVNRFRARPGHSQHQLGTTLDLTSPEAGNGIGGRFAATRASQWVRERAWEFGFVLPYTEASEPRTGYAPEPWHVRWVGRELAALLMAEGYLDRSEPVLDDYLFTLEALLAGGAGECQAGNRGGTSG